MQARFRLQFGEKKFEYDVYALVRSFYPMCEIAMWYAGEPRPAGDFDADLSFDYLPGETVFTLTPCGGAAPGEGTAAPAKEAVASEQSGAAGAVAAAAAEQSGAAQGSGAAVRFVQLPSGERFFAAAQVRRTAHADPADRLSCKNEVKRLAYAALAEASGRSLPWGDLSGIRPTKIAMRLLEAGSSDEEIAAYMRNTYLVGQEKIELALDTIHRERAALLKLRERQEGRAHAAAFGGPLLAAANSSAARGETSPAKDSDVQPLADWLLTGYSLYVGIPFCPSICLYCTFGSHPLHRFENLVEPYLQALYREIAFIAGEMRGRRLDTIYIGGGTPTALTAAQLAELLQVIAQHFDLSRVAEFTVEAGRPDTITKEKLAVLRSFPVSRISINPQTMHQKTLDIIGRGHTVAQTTEAFRMARELGFDNINMDLIVGLPGEGAAEVAATLAAVQALAPDSLTVHSLALKRAARLRLFQDTYEPISFENSDAIMRSTAACARALHMAPYYLYRQKDMAGNFENVGYATEGKACLYNMLIMEEKQTILAAGSGASTKFVFDGGRRIERAENVKNLQEYMGRLDEMLARKKRGMDSFIRPTGV